MRAIEVIKFNNLLTEVGHAVQAGYFRRAEDLLVQAQIIVTDARIAADSEGVWC